VFFFRNVGWGLFDNRVSRKIFGSKRDEIKWIKGQRISWLGHLERMEEDRMPKKIFTQELDGRRRR